MTMATIMLVLFSCLGVVFLVWFIAAAMVISGRDAEVEQRIEAMKALGWQEWPVWPAASGDYLADETEHKDG